MGEKREMGGGEEGSGERNKKEVGEKSEKRRSQGSDKKERN